MQRDDIYVDCQTCAGPTLYIHRCLHPDSPSRRFVHRDNAYGYLSQHRHPRHHGCLRLPGPAGAGDGTAHHHLQRVHHVHGQRRQVDRLADRSRLRRANDLLPAAGAHRCRIAQVGAAVQSIRFRFPAGVNPPWVLRFSASTVPIYQLALSSDNLSQSELYDYGIFRIRQNISVVPGTLLSAPHGGVVRQIMVDLNQQALLAKGLTPMDIENAITAQDVTQPTGTIKIGGREYGSSLNNSPRDALALNDVPVKVVNNSVVFMRDVAHVRDGWMVQQNIVRANGKPSALTPIYRSGTVSTLSIIDT